MARSPVGALVASVARGQEQVVHALEDVRRAAAHGIRSVLVADLVAWARERVRRARIGLDLLARAFPAARVSGPGAPGLALPIPNR